MSLAEWTRSSSRVSVVANVSGAKSLRTAGEVVVGAVVVTSTVVEVGTDVDDAGGAVGSLDEFVDDPQPTSSSPVATSATALNVPPVRPASMPGD
jgi:hypothetical protein